MKKKFLFIASAFIIMCGIASCSSGDDDNSGGGSSNGTTSGQVPTNSDNGENNHDTPYNPSNSGNSGSGDNTGGGNSGGGDNTGGGNSGGGDNTGGGNSGSGDNTGNGSTSEWKLIFEDNFEGSSSIPDQNYWSLAKKGDDTWNRHMSESYDQAYQKGGYLYLFGMLSNGEYLTGGIETIDKFKFKYGQVKCRARFLRQPQGNHTGIWMMPQPQEGITQKWPKSGEIDIMEHLDDQSVIYETVHFWDETSQKDDSKERSVTVNHEEFNTYGVVWSEESVIFTINDKEYLTYKNDNPGAGEFSYQYPFTEDFYIILSQSLGGKGTWEGEIDNSELPAIFQIDWIKVWQKE